MNKEKVITQVNNLDEYLHVITRQEQIKAREGAEYIAWILEGFKPATTVKA